MLFRLITAWIGNLIDTVATVHLYTTYDGEELNPISEWLLSRSIIGFILYKLICMSLLVTMVWCKQDWKLSKFASWLVFVNYSAISVYYLIVYVFLIIWR